jgi:hypothetical protein
MGRLKARRKAPMGEKREMPWGKISVPIVRMRDVGKISAPKRKKKE